MRFIALSILFLVCFKSSFIQAYIKLLPDGETDVENYVEILREHAQYSITLNNLMQDLSKFSLKVPIPLNGSGISLETLQMVAQGLAFIDFGELPSFINEIKEDPKVLCNLMIAVDYLDIPGLLDACIKAWISLNSNSDSFSKKSRKTIAKLNHKLSQYRTINDLFTQQHPASPELRNWLCSLSKIPTATYKLHLKSADKPISLYFSNDGSNLLCFYKNKIKIYDACNDFNYIRLVRCLSKTSDLINTIHNNYFVNTKGIYKIQDQGNLELIQEHNNNEKPHSIICFSPDGNLLVTNTRNTLKIWDVANDGSNSVQPFKTRQEGVSCLTGGCFSPDNKWFAAGSEDNNTINIWNVNDDFRFYSSLGFICGCSCIAFSPDSKLFAAGLYDGSIKIWNVDDVGGFSSRSRLYDHHKTIHSIRFSPDGKFLVSSSFGSVKIWDVEHNFQYVNALKNDTDKEGVTSICFSPDGNWLAIGIHTLNSFFIVTTTIKIWNMNVFRQKYKQLINPITIEQFLLLDEIRQSPYLLNLKKKHDLHQIYESLPPEIQKIIKQFVIE